MTSSSYLSPEPLLQNPAWSIGKLQQGTQVPSYAYADNNPVGGTDPSGLYVIGPRLADCPNYYAALLRARTRAGCDSSHSGNPQCQCQQRARACLNGCDICKTLEPGAGPALVPTSISSLWGTTPSGRTVFVPLDSCVDFSRIDELADTLIHEAVHVCEGSAFGRMSHRGANPHSPSAFCDPDDIEGVCAGRLN